MAYEIELQKTIDELGNTFAEFKSSVDSRVAAIEKNEGISEIESKLAGLNSKLEELEKLKSKLEELETQAGRIKKTSSEQAASDYEKGFNAFLRKGIENGLAELQTKAVSVGVDADGGYAVPETLDNMIGMYEKQNNPMRQECRVIPMSNENYKKLFNIGGTASGWVGETDARPETASPQLAPITPVFGEIYANPATTQKALDDLMFNVESWLGEEVGTEFAEQENAAYTTGSVAARPKGILAYTLSLAADGARPFQQIQYRTSGQAATFGATSAVAIDNLIDLTMDLKSGYRQNAKWMLPLNLLRQVRKLKDADNNLIWQPSLQAGVPSLLLGYPIVENEDMPAVADGSNSLMFGNYQRAFTIIDIRGTRVLRDPYTNKPYVHFYTTKRSGTMLANDEAVKVLRLSI